MAPYYRDIQHCQMLYKSKIKNLDTYTYSVNLEAHKDTVGSYTLLWVPYDGFVQIRGCTEPDIYMIRCKFVSSWQIMYALNWAHSIKSLILDHIISHSSSDGREYHVVNCCRLLKRSQQQEPFKSDYSYSSYTYRHIFSNTDYFMKYFPIQYMHLTQWDINSYCPNS